MACRPAVLVVEDDAQFRSDLEWELTDEGYNVRTACNGKEAMRVLQDWPPDVAITDLEMPVMDGRAFLNTFRQHETETGARTPVIVYSAAPRLKALTHALDADECIAKGNLDELLDTVERFVRNNAAADLDWTREALAQAQASLDWTRRSSDRTSSDLEIDLSNEDLGPAEPRSFTLSKSVYGVLLPFAGRSVEGPGCTDVA
jgi:DNA-binding response OmpR family regulator